MSAVLNDHIVRRIVHFMAPLQRQPWAGWEPGSVVQRQYEHDDYLRDEAVNTRSLITFEVVEQDKRIHRIENINGRDKRQEFLVGDEHGLMKAKRSINGIDAALMIDGVMVMSVLRKINEAAADYERFVYKDTHQWSLGAFPSIILRFESESEQWFVQSLNAVKHVGDNAIPCVRIEYKKTISLNEYLVTSRYLCGKVPGHLLEEQNAYYRKDDTSGQHVLQWRSRETVSFIKAY